MRNRTTRASQPSLTRVLQVSVATALLGIANTVAAASVSAGSVQYIQADCLVPSMVGNPCAVWGVLPRFVSADTKARALPQVVVDSITGCLQDGLYAFVENWNDVSGPIPPQYKKLLSGGYFAIGCVEGITQANIKLN